MTAALSLVDPHLLERRDLTVDDLGDLPDELHYELIDGRLVLTPAALPIHQNIASYVLNALREHLPRTHYVSIEQSVRFGFRNEKRPDVMAMRIEGAGRSPVDVADVCLVVEVISPSSKVYDRDGKMKDFAYAGIPTYWIIDPLGPRVTFSEFALESGNTYALARHTDQKVTVEQPWAVTLDVTAWTEERDWLQAHTRPDR